MPPLPFSLQQLATRKAAAGHTYPSYEELSYARDNVIQLQSVYATKMAQISLVRRLFCERYPVVILRGESSEVTLHLGEDTADLYQVIHEALDKRLSELEADIIDAHIALKRHTKELALEQLPSEQERQQYAAAVLHLCTVPPASPTPGPVPTPTPTREQMANARTPRTATTVVSTGLGKVGSAGSVANAAAA